MHSVSTQLAIVGVLAALPEALRSTLEASLGAKPDREVADREIREALTNWDKISSPYGEQAIDAAFVQTNKYVAAAADALGVKIGG